MDQYSNIENPKYSVNIRILVVDDAEVNRVLLSHLLSKYSVDTAENGSIAYQLCQQNTYHLIIMDIEMPIMNGFETIGKIRNLNLNNNSLPIVALTAHNTLDMINRIKDAGFNTFLSKPINKKSLRSAVNKLLT